MVIWVIGLSGSGKTTLASEVVNIIRNRGRKIIFLDGDEVRNLFGNDLGHELRDREKMRNVFVVYVPFLINKILMLSAPYCRCFHHRKNGVDAI